MSEVNARLEALACAIRRRGLAVPALVLLEIIRPMRFLCSQGFLLLEPLVGPFSRDRESTFGHVLADERSLDKLVSLVQSDAAWLDPGQQNQAPVGPSEENP